MLVFLVGYLLLLLSHLSDRVGLICWRLCGLERGRRVRLFGGSGGRFRGRGRGFGFLRMLSWGGEAGVGPGRGLGF